MEVLGLKLQTGAERKHEKQLQDAQLAAEAAKHERDLAAARQQAEEDRMAREYEADREAEIAQAKLQQSERNRQTRQRKYELEADTKKYTAKLESDFEMHKSDNAKDINRKTEEESTHREQLSQEGQTKRKEIAENEKTKRTQIAQDAETQRQEQAESEATKRVQLDVDFKKKASEDMAKMFSTYMEYTSESYKATLEFLYKESVERKEKFLAVMNSARNEKALLLDLSKKAKGQEKLDYINKLDELEYTIQREIDLDAECDKELLATFAELKYKQEKLDRQGQNMISTNTLFLNTNPESE